MKKILLILLGLTLFNINNIYAGALVASGAAAINSSLNSNRDREVTQYKDNQTIFEGKRYIFLGFTSYNRTSTFFDKQNRYFILIQNKVKVLDENIGFLLNGSEKEAEESQEIYNDCFPKDEPNG